VLVGGTVEDGLLDEELVGEVVEVGVEDGPLVEELEEVVHSTDFVD